MNDPAPTWLKVMENGALGEARARAFLMERFWVLERSVDVEGADLLIQRRLSGANFLDRDPPRLGVVQVKYIQDGATSIGVRKSYIADAHGKPYTEFFLMVFTGREDSQRIFLLAAQDVLTLFNEIEVNGVATLRLGGAALMNAAQHEVLQRSRALDRIEHALKNADFLANRRFLRSMNHVRFAPENIDHEFTLPLGNITVNIPASFFDFKKELRRVLWEMEEVVEGMQKMLAATDPLEAKKIYEADVEDHVGGYGRHIMFSTDFVDDELFRAADNHRQRLAKLNELGLANAYFRLVDAFDHEAAKQCMALGASAPSVIEIEIAYDPATLENPRIIVRPSALDEHNWRSLASTKGRHVVAVAMPRGFNEAETDALREKALQERWWAIRYAFQHAFEVEYLGQDLVEW